MEDLRNLAGNVPRLHMEPLACVCVCVRVWLMFVLVVVDTEAMHVRSAAAAWIAALAAMNLSSLRERCLR